MLTVTEDWKITNKIILAVTDNGANIKKRSKKSWAGNILGAMHTL